MMHAHERNVVEMFGHVQEVITIAASHCSVIVDIFELLLILFFINSCLKSGHKEFTVFN